MLLGNCQEEMLLCKILQEGTLGDEVLRSAVMLCTTIEQQSILLQCKMLCTAEANRENHTGSNPLLSAFSPRAICSEYLIIYHLSKEKYLQGSSPMSKTGQWRVELDLLHSQFTIGTIVSRIIFPVKERDFSKTQNLLIHPSSDISCWQPVLHVASQFFKLCKKETVNGPFFGKVHLNYLGTFRKQGKCHNFCVQPVKMLCWRIIFLQNEPPCHKQFLP